MAALPKDELLRLQEENGYGLIRAIDGAGEGFQAVWAAPWPPPEHMLMIVPTIFPPRMVEIPEEPEHLVPLREGVEHGWSIYEMVRGDYSKIPDEDAKAMTRVIRVADYTQGERFEP